MISKGSEVVRDDPDVLMEKKDIRRRQPVDDVHEFYNVLWIERDKDGVARRQGLGRIFKEAWDLEVGDEKVEVSRPSFETALSGTLLYIKRARKLRSRICEIAIYEQAAAIKV
jgi:hypothetical protein